MSIFATYMDYYYLIFLPVAVGLGGLMTITFNGRWHQLHDRVYLALLLCSIVTVYITLRALVVGTSDYAYIVLDNIETLTGLLLCPLFFLYITCITHDTRWHRWYWWLFAPGAILSVVGTILSILVGWDRILEVRGHDYNAFVPNPESIVEELYLLVNIQAFNVTLEVMAIVLIALSIYHLARYRMRAGDYYANLEDSSFNNMNCFLSFGIIFLLAIFIVTSLIWNEVDLGNGLKLCISLFLSVILLVMLYNALQIRMTKQQEEAISSLTPALLLAGYDKVEQLKERGIFNSEGPQTSSSIENFPLVEWGTLDDRIATWETRKDKPFCKEGITLSGLAREFGVSSRTLSEYINQQKGVNFNAWVNALRVEEAKHLLQMSKELKIGFISDICGFGTQSAFSKTFRQMAGQSPQSFRESAT